MLFSRLVEYYLEISRLILNDVNGTKFFLILAFKSSFDVESNVSAKVINAVFQNLMAKLRIISDYCHIFNLSWQHKSYLSFVIEEITYA